MAAGLAAVTFATVGCGNVSGNDNLNSGLGSGIGGTGAAAAPGRASTGSTPLPCNVTEAVNVCQTCHTQHPVSGVPMSLMTWEDFQAQSVSDPTKLVYQLANTRINNPSNPMPPAKDGALGPNDKATIQSWLDGGAQKGTDPSCKPVLTPPGSGGSTGGGGNPSVGSSGGTGSSGAPNTGAGGGGSPPPQDAGAEGPCYQLLAHGQATSGDTTPFQVQGEEYVAFDFNAPWPANAQGISFKTVIDAHPEIVHHWLLYVASAGFFPGPMPDGAIEPNENGQHIGATLIAGWAPGGNNGINLPSDVGMDINGQSKRLILEIHFYPGAGSFTSRAGVEVCTAKAPRPNVATVSWLGTENISLPPSQTNSVTGTCAPNVTQDIHILRTWPHMHKIGVHMKTVVNHAAGTTEMLVDKDFNFASQVSYDNPILIKAGDKLVTTCTYNNTTTGTVTYGTKTTNEMCFNFVTAWPANTLNHGTAMNGSENPCMN